MYVRFEADVNKKSKKEGLILPGKVVVLEICTIVYDPKKRS